MSQVFLESITITIIRQTQFGLLGWILSITASLKEVYGRWLQQVSMKWMFYLHIEVLITTFTKTGTIYSRGRWEKNEDVHMLIISIYRWLWLQIRKSYKRLQSCKFQPFCFSFFFYFFFHVCVRAGWLWNCGITLN